MPDADVPKWPPLSRELGRRPKPDDYLPGRAASDEREINPSPDREEDLFPGVNLRTLQEHLLRHPLDEIAMLVGGLTYGDMIDFADAIWRIQPEGVFITQENLPALLYRWSKSHRSVKTAAAESHHAASLSSSEGVSVVLS
jgi:hypothetical protein